MDFPSNDSYFSLLNLSFEENCHISIFTTFAKQSMQLLIDYPINRNHSAAKISKVMSSSNYSLRRPQKLVIPQAVIGKDGLLYIQTCTSKQSYTARVRVDCAV